MKTNTKTLSLSLQAIGALACITSLMLVLTEPRMFIPALCTTVLGFAIAITGWSLGGGNE
jgi:hypothetical protein